MIYWQSVLHSYYRLSCFRLLLLIQGRHHYQLHQLFNKFLLWLCGFLLPWVHVPKAQCGSRQSCKRRYDCLLLIMQSFVNCLILSLKCHKTDGKAIGCWFWLIHNIHFCSTSSFTFILYLLQWEIVWALHFVLRSRSPLLFFSWFLCSFRRWISVCHLPRSHCNTTRVIDLGSYLLHHAVDSGHWQCSEYPHRHSQLHPFQPNNIPFLCQITVFHYSQIYSLGAVPIQASTGIFSDLTVQDWLFLSNCCVFSYRWVAWNQWSRG